MLTEQPARDIDDGCLHKSARFSDVSMDEAGTRWTFKPFELPILPLFILSHVVILADFSYIFCETYITSGRNDPALGA